MANKLAARVALTETDAECDALAVPEGERLGEPDDDASWLRDALVLALLVADGETDVEPAASDAAGVPENDPVADEEPDSVSVADGEPDTVSEADGDCETE